MAEECAAAPHGVRLRLDLTCSLCLHRSRRHEGSHEKEHERIKGLGL